MNEILVATPIFVAPSLSAGVREASDMTTLTPAFPFPFALPFCLLGRWHETACTPKVVPKCVTIHGSSTSESSFSLRKGCCHLISSSHFHPFRTKLKVGQRFLYFTLSPPSMSYLATAQRRRSDFSYFGTAGHFQATDQKNRRGPK